MKKFKDFKKDFDFSPQIKIENKPILALPNFLDLNKIYLYRTVLDTVFKNDIETNKMINLVECDRYKQKIYNTTDWTIDSNYWYNENNRKIRLVVKLTDVINHVGNENILNILFGNDNQFGSEGEIRLFKPIPYSILNKIELCEDSYNKGFVGNDDAFGDMYQKNPIANWFPNELANKIAFVNDDYIQKRKNQDNAKLCQKVGNYYSKLFKTHKINEYEIPCGDSLKFCLSA